MEVLRRPAYNRGLVLFRFYKPYGPEAVSAILKPESKQLELLSQ
jgi:hypothetical protein